MRCPRCATENPDGAKFCIECGAAFDRRCPNCGAAAPARAKFCAECGTALGASGEPVAASPRSSGVPPAAPVTPPRHLADRIRAEQAALEARGGAHGERKTITALFADIKGSMALIEDLDPEDARSVIDPALQLMMDAVHRYEGYVAQSMGDGIFALFGAPLAHEDHAQRALFAALRMQERGRRYAERLRGEKGINLQIRVGVNSGAVVVRSIRKDDLHTDYVPVGHSTSLAARLEGLATPGSIVVSAHTHKLAEGYFEFRDLGAAKVKGVSGPLHIYEVLGVGPLRTRLQVSAARGLSRFVGRKNEIDDLKRIREQARGGQGQVVGVVGEPGVGKSRLFHEFRLLSESTCLVLATFCQAHGRGSAYLPLVDLLRGYFGVQPQDDERTLHEKVAGRVVALDRDLEDGLPYVLALLGHTEFIAALQQMDPDIRRQRSFDAVKRLLLRESRTRTLLLIFEDLQWLDPETQAFLDALADGLATAAVVLLTNYRPGYRHDWGGKTYYSQLRLNALGVDDARELIDALLGDAARTTVALDPLKRLILDKTEGTPFFIEEMIRALFDQGILTHGLGGVTLTAALDDLRIPDTVQGVLAGRIDLLGSEEKDLLQTAAVIGREFPLGLLGRVAQKSEADLAPALSRLQSAEFIYEQPAFPDVAYTFKHLLTQEVAYGTLVSAHRRELHARTAAAISDAADPLDEPRLRDLAYHSVRSGDTERAAASYQQAGDLALHRSSYTEALHDFTRALNLLPSLPQTQERQQQELSLLIALGMSLMATRGHTDPEVERVYSRARKLAGTLGDVPQTFGALFALWRFYVARGEYPEAGRMIESLRTLSEGVPDSERFLPAQQALGMTAFRFGSFVEARTHLERSVALYETDRPDADHPAFTQGDLDPGVSSLSFLAWTLWHLGYPDQALQRSNQAVEVARARSHPYSLVFALHFSAGVHRFRRDGARAQAQAQVVMRMAAEQGFPFFQAGGTFLRGWALAAQGHRADGIGQMEEGLRLWRESGTRQLGQISLLLAEAYAATDRVSDALAIVDASEAELHESNERWWEAELLRVRGEVRHLSDPVSASCLREAATYFERAIETARRQQATSLALRAAVSLAKLWQGTDRQAEGYRRLADLHAAFGEGGDTADLQAAGELLAEQK